MCALSRFLDRLLREARDTVLEMAVKPRIFGEPLANSARKMCVPFCLDFSATSETPTNTVRHMAKRDQKLVNMSELFF